MKKADVKVGETYWTKVSGEHVQVTVLFEQNGKFLVAREGTRNILTKPRSAAALHPLDKHPTDEFYKPLREILGT